MKNGSRVHARKGFLTSSMPRHTIVVPIRGNRSNRCHQGIKIGGIDVNLVVQMRQTHNGIGL